MSTIGSKLKTLRKGRGLTQLELSERLNLSRATISNYEVGRRSPHLSELRRFAEFYGVSLDYFGVETEDESFELFIRDNAVKFNAFSIATTDGKIANTDLDALGMSIIKNKVSEFFYRHYKGFNILYIKI